MNRTTDAETTPSALLRNLLLFGRVLRALGMPVTSGRLIELASSLDHVQIGRREDFRDAARCLLVSRREDLALFDEAFDRFWRAWPERRSDDPLSRVIDDLARHLPHSQQAPPRALGRRRNREVDAANLRGDLRPLGAGDQADDAEGESILAMYSPGEVLRHKDFAYMSDEELADARQFLAQLNWKIAHRRSLRPRPSAHGRRLDVRRSLRRNLRHGGELMHLSYRGPKPKRRQLVLICDISGSMDRYTRLFLHFLHSVETSAPKVEVFVFGTRLTRITRALRRKNSDEAIEAVSHEVQDWSGGTRIGESLRSFNLRWARRVLGHGAVVLIISDGWDRGDPAILATEMERLQRSSYRLIWLNPLLGSANYRPLTQGIQAALPFVDDFLPVHNLASLSELAAVLNAVQQGRPARKQHNRSLIA